MDSQPGSPPCPDDETLRAFALGDLDDEGIEAVRGHLDSCPSCERRAEALDARTDHVLDELRRSLADPVGRDGSESPRDQGPPVAPDYVVEGPPIGVGATGLIYKARHVKLDRPVALKMIARRGGDVARLFEIEARAVAQLQHPNIVQIYDIGGGGDRPFLALELVDGGSLEDRMTGAPWPPREAVEMILTLAEAVDHAHRHGIVHCDLKPSNVLTTREGTAKIADFGVAKWTESDGYWGDRGGRRGTPRYMAPEQAGGPGEVGPATDVHGLGTILYEMLAGRVPHLGATASEILRSLREDEPPPPSRFAPDVPLDLDRLALRCLRKRPEDRYRDARELAADLRRFLAGPPPRDRGARWKLPALAAAAAAVVAMAWSSAGPPPSVFVVRADGARRPRPDSAWNDPVLSAKTEVQDDGTIRLGAGSAAVSGPSLKFEGSFGNLGYWHDREDRAAWKFLVEPNLAARYGLGLEYSNRNREAVNRYEVRLDGRSFTRATEGTDGWSDYRVFPIADVDLGAGFHTIEVRPVEPLRKALFDLRAVVLSPAGP